MIVNVIPNSANVVGRLFRERESLSNQTTAPLAQRSVEPLNMTGLATLLTCQVAAVSVPGFVANMYQLFAAKEYQVCAG
jgi:hypothetical protein